MPSFRALCSCDLCVTRLSAIVKPPLLLLLRVNMAKQQQKKNYTIYDARELCLRRATTLMMFCQRWKAQMHLSLICTILLNLKIRC